MRSYQKIQSICELPPNKFRGFLGKTVVSIITKVKHKDYK